MTCNLYILGIRLHVTNKTIHVAKNIKYVANNTIHVAKNTTCNKLKILCM